VLAAVTTRAGALLSAELDRDGPISPLPDRVADIDKGHGHWRAGGRRFAGEYRLPDIAPIVRVGTETSGRRGPQPIAASTSPPAP
jgi:hypothetical protein